MSHVLSVCISFPISIKEFLFIVFCSFATCLLFPQGTCPHDICSFFPWRHSRWWNVPMFVLNSDLSSGMLIFFYHRSCHLESNTTLYVCVTKGTRKSIQKGRYTVYKGPNVRLFMFGTCVCTVHSCICRHHYQHHKLSQYYLSFVPMYLSVSITQTLDSSRLFYVAHVSSSSHSFLLTIKSNTHLTSNNNHNNYHILEQLRS